MKKLTCVLVIDDILEDRVFIKNIFNKKDIEVLSCKNTLEAMEFIEKFYEIDLVIINLNLEFLNGIDSIKLIQDKFLEFFNEVSLIMTYSSLDINKEDLDFFSKKIKYKLQKPYLENDFFDLINSIFQEDDFNNFEQKHFNVDSLKKRLNYNEELYLELIKESMEFINEYIKNISTNIEKGDSNLIYRMAHKLKGISLNMSFELMAHLAESILENNTNKNLCLDILVQIQEEFDLLKKQLI